MNTALRSLLVASLLVSAACSSTQKTALVPTAQNPAAIGSLQTRRTDNANTEVDLTVDHMAPPANVADDATIYVVWAKPLTADGLPQNVGSLIIGKDRSGSLKTKTPHERFEVLVTPEASGEATQPSHEPVLKAKVDH
jgi:hypothetical protein